MKEEVFYLRWPKEKKYAYMPQITKTPLPIFPRENYYLKERSLEISGMTNLLPCIINFEDMEENKKLEPIVNLTKSALSRPTSIWEVRKLDKIPKDAILIDFEKERIDKVIEAYNEERKASDELLKELEEYKKEYGKYPEGPYKPRVNPFAYLEKFYKICEETFVPPKG